MTNTNSSQPPNDTLKGIIEGAISSELGSIDALPAEVADRIREIYRAFIPVYIETIRVRDSHPQDWLPQQIVPDPEVVEDLLHFFSDYQELARRFKRINRQVKHMLTIDRQTDPHRFQRCVAEILSDERGPSIMDAIVDP